MRPMPVLAVLTLLVATAGIAVVTASRSTTAPQGTSDQGYILQAGEGERLVPCPVGDETPEQWADWSFNIKVGPRTGATRLAMGTEVTPAGERVPLHRHEHEDEILFVHSGTAVGIVGDEREQVGPGATMYVPQGVWHGLENPSDEPAELVWFVTPPRLQSFFRETSAPPDQACDPLTPDRLEEIMREHGYTEKMEGSS